MKATTRRRRLGTVLAGVGLSAAAIALATGSAAAEPPVSAGPRVMVNPEGSGGPTLTQITPQDAVPAQVGPSGQVPELTCVLPTAPGDPSVTTYRCDRPGIEVRPAIPSDAVPARPAAPLPSGSAGF
ncbi:hypothetical protein [Nocardia arthritidis]|uniref:Ig-like domain-containing protein n=1 Tax=Nocardia arthritidis TaxID=228602 RepID=A0A6G9YAL7_9NOCA|nr:hypothetical protein [Nocardia arthritidis]QIS10279.1 hypothetical protein F5544_11940 [Nocardia arthritidis]